MMVGSRVIVLIKFENVLYNVHNIFIKVLINVRISIHKLSCIN